MSDFETPIMRDLSRLLWPIALGMLFFIGIFMLFIFPFSATIYGEHCSATSSWSIATIIYRSLMMQC